MLQRRGLFVSLVLIMILSFSFMSASVSSAKYAKVKEKCGKRSTSAKTLSISDDSILKSDIDISYSEADLRLMSSIIYCEANGESYQGKVAVGIVVMNRVASDKFPDTIRRVIYERNQFTPTRNGSMKKRLAQYDAGKTRSKAWRQCIKAAKEALDGADSVVVRDKEKDMDNILFFCVGMSNPKFRLGRHGFR